MDIEIWLQQVHTEGMSAMCTVYTQYRAVWLAFAQKYTDDRDVQLQALHDAIIILYEKIGTGKYDANKSSIKTYLFTIAKNKLIDRLKRDAKKQTLPLLHDTNDISNEPMPEKDYNRLRQAFAQLGDTCKQLLIMYYYESMDTKSILQKMNYSNQNVLYSVKSRCLKKLKDILMG